MGKSRDLDVPRPQDGATACLARLRAGHHHALADLAAALEREGDPRAGPVNAMLVEAMAGISACRGRPDAGAWVVARWHGLVRNVLRAMGEPRYAAVAARAAGGEG